jgi:hypothetical protein
MPPSSELPTSADPDRPGAKSWRMVTDISGLPTPMFRL